MCLYFSQLIRFNKACTHSRTASVSRCRRVVFTVIILHHIGHLFFRIFSVKCHFSVSFCNFALVSFKNVV